METNTFYKEAKIHDDHSHHLTHIKYNTPFNLARYILVFVSGEQWVALRLKELRKWLLNCGYPESVIEKSFFNANLQGPANKPANSKNILFLVSTCYPNFDIPSIIKSKIEAKSKWINQRKFWRNTNSFVIKTTN